MTLTEEIGFPDLFDDGQSGNSELKFIVFENNVRLYLSKFDKDDEYKRFYVRAIIRFLEAYDLKELDIIDISEAPQPEFQKLFSKFIKMVHEYRVISLIKLQSDNKHIEETGVYNEEMEMFLDIVKDVDSKFDDLHEASSKVDELEVAAMLLDNAINSSSQTIEDISNMRNKINDQNDRNAKKS